MNNLHLYINGQWVKPNSAERADVVSPATEQVIATVAMGNSADVDLAVKAARTAFASWSVTTLPERVDLLERILASYKLHAAEIDATICKEMGAAIKIAEAQSHVVIGTLRDLIDILKTFKLTTYENGALILREPVGVAAMITPWNAPVSQITSKVFPALAAGCTVVTKPSEYAPLSPLILAEVLHEAGVPPGVFNLVNGTGSVVGAALASHPDVDMVSFTGSTGTGANIAKMAADTVKRVHQELGGKSANIILDDADLEQAVKIGVRSCFANSGQICTSPSRMLVPHSKMADAERIARKAAEELKVGAPEAADTRVGPVVSKRQFDMIQSFIKKGIEEGAELIAGGPGRAQGFDAGFYVKPTVFSKVTPDMTIAKSEVFGPVLSIMGYATDEEAIAIANDSVYGLAGYVQSKSVERALAVAGRLRAGSISINYPQRNMSAPLGGYKQSGNGRQFGVHGLMEFFEIKSITCDGLPG